MKSPKLSSRSLLLDLLRIFAALWVVSFHWVGRGGYSPGLNNQIDFSIWPHFFSTISNPGFLGVDIFFILSGTVIGKSAINKSWQDFSQNRFLRLFPAYLLATVIAIAIVPFVDSDWKRSDAIASISGLQLWIGGPTIIGAAWTLAIEVQFYAIVALFILLKKSLNIENIRQLAFVIILFSIISSVVNFGPVSFIAISPWGGYFALGMLLSTTRDMKGFRKNLFPILISMFLAGNTLFTRLTAMYPEASPIYRLGIPLLILFCVTAIILITSLGLFPSETKKEWLGIATLSLMTYPIYLFHETIGLSIVSLLSITGVDLRFSFLLTAVIVIVISWICVKWLEPLARKNSRSLFGWNKPNNHLST